MTFSHIRCHPVLLLYKDALAVSNLWAIVRVRVTGQTGTGITVDAVIIKRYDRLGRTVILRCLHICSRI